MTAQTKTEARKQKILEAAAKVFAGKEFHETSISEISREAGVSEASIYEYFTTKENLLFSIPGENIKQVIDTINFHLKLIRGDANKLYSFCNMILTYLRDNPTFTSVLLLILKHNRKFLDTDSHQAVREILNICNRIIIAGIDSGEFRSDIDPYLIRSILMGSIEHISINWLLRGYPEDIQEYAGPLFDVIIKGIENKSIEDYSTCPVIAGLFANNSSGACSLFSNTKIQNGNKPKEGDDSSSST